MVVSAKRPVSRECEFVTAGCASLMMAASLDARFIKRQLMRLDNSPTRNTGSPQDESALEADLLAREFDFLLACVRRFFQPEAPIPTAAGLDWRKLVELAQAHAVAALFCRAVRERPDIPIEVHNDLQRCVFEAACFDLTLTAELAELLELFRGHEIQVVSLKGPVLASTLYGTAALRSSSDLDLLVHPDDLLRANQLLKDKGYQLESVLPWPTDSAYFRRRDSEISFSRKIACQTDTLRIDLHWRLLPWYFPRSFGDRELWQNLSQVPVGGAFASTLQAENQLLFLCAHGTKHLWGRLGWICDIARLVQIERSLDWTRVFDQARRTDTSRMVVLGLVLASELLGVDLPSPAVGYTGMDWTYRALAMIKKRLHDQVFTPSGAVESALLTLDVFERTGQRMRFVLGTFLQPTEAEHKALKLPPFLYWLYYLFRPARLANKYLRFWLDEKGAKTAARSGRL
jgi:Uncharacterised nucleotidyltransferase